MAKENYREALTFGFLTKWYDSIVGIMGFGKKYYTNILKHIEPKENDKVLDIGTGTGNLAIAVKRKYPQVKTTGVDPDKKILEIARKKIKREELDIELINAPAQKLPFPSESFDFVISSLVIHHVPKLFKRDAFFEMKRVLKKDGTILIVDFGIPKNIIAKLISFALSLIEDVGPNREGLIPNTLVSLGFRDVKEIDSKFGLISFYRAKK